LLFLWQYQEDEIWKSYDDEICILLNICRRRYEDQIEEQADKHDPELLGNLRFVYISSGIRIDLNKMQEISQDNVSKKI
jgi:hypothetical protein